MDILESHILPSPGSGELGISLNMALFSNNGTTCYLVSKSIWIGEGNTILIGVSAKSPSIACQIARIPHHEISLISECINLK